MDVSQLQRSDVLHGRPVDSTAQLANSRWRRWSPWAALVAVALGWPLARVATGRSPVPDPLFVHEHPQLVLLLAVLALVATAAALAIAAAGRSPHTLIRPDDASIRFEDVVGASATTHEAADTLQLFLNHRRFREEMGGTARRGVLFEGASGTGKTHLAKAIATEAGVPFLFVSASAFPSMGNGQTNRKIRSFFRALRRAAHAEGGAIGFIEGLDAIGAARTSGGASSAREGSGVNELLVQMQSFDLPTTGQRLHRRWVHILNRALPAGRRLTSPVVLPANVLLLATTNRTGDLDQALLSPGRFDRVIHFDLPPRTDRIEIAQYYLARKRHDHTVSPEFVADLTAGYTPARLERLLDEALVVALRDDRSAMTYHDVIDAQLITEVGLAQQVGYHPEEKRRVAMHEAGHALVAALLGRDVKLASVLRRSGSLGMVAHGDVEERFLRTPSETRDLMAIAMAGRAAEIQEFGEASAGIAGDLSTATRLAAELVGSMGIGESLISLDAAVIGGAENLVAKVLQDDRARAKADQLLHTAADRAACALLEHRRSLLALADALCELDELSGDEVHAIVAGSMAH